MLVIGMAIHLFLTDARAPFQMEFWEALHEWDGRPWTAPKHDRRKPCRWELSWRCG